jgi:hypothetical protein
MPIKLFPIVKYYNSRIADDNLRLLKDIAGPNSLLIPNEDYPFCLK